MRKAYTVTSSAVIGAPAEIVYGIIADYREGHPHILPRKYFTSLEVEQGGTGEGTVIRFQMRVLGKTQNFRAVVTEPVPGRILVETNVEPGDSVTTFIVEPEGARSVVTFSTEMDYAGGLAGAFKRFVTTRMLLRIYARELELLDRLAVSRASGRQTTAPVDA